MTVRNTQNQPKPPTLQERITWAEARLRDAQAMAAREPTSYLYALAVVARQAELDALKRHLP